MSCAADSSLRMAVWRRCRSLYPKLSMGRCFTTYTRVPWGSTLESTRCSPASRSVFTGRDTTTMSMTGAVIVVVAHPARALHPRPECPSRALRQDTLCSWWLWILSARFPSLQLATRISWSWPITLHGGPRRMPFPTRRLQPWRRS